MSDETERTTALSMLLEGRKLLEAGWTQFRLATRIEDVRFSSKEAALSAGFKDEQLGKNYYDLYIGIQPSATDSLDQRYVCAIGAIVCPDGGYKSRRTYETSDGSPRMIRTPAGEAIDLLAMSLPTSYRHKSIDNATSWHKVVGFNNEPTTTKEMVIDLFDRAIDLALKMKEKEGA